MKILSLICVAVIFTAVLIIAVLAVSPIHADPDPVAESGDAGDLPATAQDVSNTAVTEITGTITGTLQGWPPLCFDMDVDMYKIYVNEPALFLATTYDTGNDMTGRISSIYNDTTLFLFDEEGNAIYWNNDTPRPGYITPYRESTLPHTFDTGQECSLTQAGIYYLAITGYYSVPYDSNNNRVFYEGTSWKTFCGWEGTGPLHHWKQVSGYTYQTGSYRIVLTGVGPPNDPPVAICRDATLELDENGEATLDPGQVNDGSYDPDGVLINLSVSPSSFTCADIGKNNVTLTVTDDGGATGTCTAVVTVVDNIKPSITCPADITLECPADTGPDSIGYATAEDNCDVVITWTDEVTEGCGNAETITRTWTATDKGNNTASCKQTIAVVDTTPPTIECPADVTFECPAADTSPAVTGEATGSDTCGDVKITYNDSVIPGCGNTETITRTWTAIDECGNTATCDQVITMVDTTPPSISCPADVTLECPADTSPDTNGVATATDTCGDVAVTYNDSVIPGCGNTEIITRTWTAIDECGNTATCDQVITVVDTTPPVIILLGDNPQTIECGNPYTELGAMASDACCGDLTDSIVIDASVVNISAVGSYTVTYNVTDCNNNTANQVMRTVNVVDTTPPELSVVVSPNELWPPNHKMVEVSITATASDIGDPTPLVVLTSVVSNEPDNAKGNGDGNTVNDIQGADIGTEDYVFLLRAERDGNGDGRVYTITYTATDTYGNSASVIITVTILHDLGKKAKS